MLLLESCPSCLLLIRFSRTEPEFLAFSYKDERGQIRHSLNKEESDSKVRTTRHTAHAHVHNARAHAHRVGWY